MTHKHKILEELGEDSLLMERRIHEGLAANDRAKYYLSLLGLAYEQAVSPKVDPSDLSVERKLVRIEDEWLDAFILSATRQGGLVAFPRGGEVIRRALVEAHTMLSSLEACEEVTAPELRGRLTEIESTLAKVAEDGIPGWVIDRIASANREGGDGLHLFIMDAHRAIERCAHRIATEKVEGVSVYGIREEDRDTIVAFAGGLARTARLKWDHPGLGTTATRIGERLVIQNDIGETDAHIFILAVEADRVEFTYTDVHKRRLAFFRSLLELLAPSWHTETTRRTDGLPETKRFYILRGSVRFSDRAGLHKTLERIAAKLVFLIDWNKARRRLRTFAKGSDAIEILRWAAEEEVGHMAFLMLGGEELVYESMSVMEPGAIRPGETLYSILGRVRAIDFLMDVLRIASKGMQADASDLVIRDRVKAAFFRHYATRQRGPLDTCRELAALGVEEAITIRDMLRAGGRHDVDFLERNVLRIKRWEEEGDQILARFRKEARGRDRAARMLPTAMRIEEQQDCLEEAAYLLVLLDPDHIPSDVRLDLERLADLCLRTSQEAYRTIVVAEDSHQNAMGLEEFSRRVDRLLSIAERAKDVRRAVRRRLGGWEDAPAGAMVNILDFASQILGACESMARAAMTLHEAIFEGVPSLAIDSPRPVNS